MTIINNANKPDRADLSLFADVFPRAQCLPASPKVSLEGVSKCWDVFFLELEELTDETFSFQQRNELVDACSFLIENKSRQADVERKLKAYKQIEGIHEFLTDFEAEFGMKIRELDKSTEYNTEEFGTRLTSLRLLAEKARGVYGGFLTAFEGESTVSDCKSLNQWLDDLKLANSKIEKLLKNQDKSSPQKEQRYYDWIHYLADIFESNGTHLIPPKDKTRKGVFHNMRRALIDAMPVECFDDWSTKKGDAGDKLAQFALRERKSRDRYSEITVQQALKKISVSDIAPQGGRHTP